ncbi:DNA polymerase III subunit gamma and tau, partial [Pseudonocardia sp.]|uniref:DNA polymerase III subunit gamma and tau n=1 Tax=Pseudonocardia sp. TaxID=60912 RepID=UPI00261D8F2F
MALALYRKYRPAKFAEVVGQEHVTEPLSTALAAGRINHAYLFSGPRGCGKTSSARILARSLNCVEGPTPDPCGVCASCVSLAPGGPGNIDVTELDAASHGGVDDTRELRDRAFFAPAESRYRVFIVDEAHMITTQGFNALLKIVEEPPEHLVFVFATTEPEKVLPTIRSRTHHYPFRLIPPGTLRKLLEGICAEEGVTVAPAVYPLVIRAGGGSARDSLSVLDQLLAGAGPEGVTYERAVALLGVTDVSLIDDMVDALAASDRAAVFEAVDRLVEAGHDPRRFASDLLQRLRDITLLQAVPEAVDRGLVEAADDELARMVEQAGRLGAATLTRYGEIVHAGLTEMRGATAPRLLLELLCARMLLPAATTAEPGLLERLERLERRNDIASGPLPPGEAGGDAPPPRFQRPSAREEQEPAAPAPAADVPPAPHARSDERHAPRSAEDDNGSVAATPQTAAGVPEAADAGSDQHSAGPSGTAPAARQDDP